MWGDESVGLSNLNQFFLPERRTRHGLWVGALAPTTAIGAIGLQPLKLQGLKPDSKSHLMSRLKPRPTRHQTMKATALRQRVPRTQMAMP
jgi:hypothetical protein